MTDQNLQQNPLDELRVGMSALKKSLYGHRLISDESIRKAMCSKSRWLNNLVIAEFIALPLLCIFLIFISLSTGMNIWVMIAFLLMALADTLLDVRTLRISRKWIQEETLLGLAQKLVKKKIERKRQTIISSLLLLPFIVWFTYEIIKHFTHFGSHPNFYLIWVCVSLFWIIIAAGIILFIYRKAQSTNTSMLKKLHTFQLDETT